MEKNKIKKFFTIIEILIVFTIIFIFSTISFINYRNYNEEIKLRNEGKKIVEYFELFKKKAISSQLYDNDCTDFNGYKILINSDGAGYEIFFGCNGDYKKIQSYNFPKNIIFTIGSNSGFYFPPKLEGLNIDIDNLRIKNNNINKCFDIFINKKGVIDINESLFSC